MYRIWQKIRNTAVKRAHKVLLLIPNDLCNQYQMILCQLFVTAFSGRESEIVFNYNMPQAVV